MMVSRRSSIVGVLAVLLLSGAAGCEPSSTGTQAGGESGEEIKTKADTGARDQQQSPETLAELPEGVNAVQNEMRLLDTAMRNTLTLIANDDLSGIPAQIERVHPARQLTEKALKQGKYRPPKNSDKLEAFEREDQRFHRTLKRLLRAAKDDDLRAATARYSDLVEGCTSCHTKFRFGGRKAVREWKTGDAGSTGAGGSTRDGRPGDRGAND